MRPNPCTQEPSRHKISSSRKIEDGGTLSALSTVQPNLLPLRFKREHMAQVSITVNGKQRTAEVEPRMLLVHFLREQLNLTGTHVGCDTSQCGACTVLIDGRSAKSCTVFAVQADGSEVTTIEGLAEGDQLHPLQTGFWEEHGLQCGYCTPGMIMSCVNLLNDNPTPSEREIREGLDGNLCRCTGYQHIVNAVQHAATKG